MIKFVIRNEGLYKQLRTIPIVKKFFVFDISQFYRVKDNQLFDQIFSDISNPNGTSKTTSANRFEDLDKWLMESLPSKKHRVHDVAVSSGITSLYLYNQLLKEDKCQSFCISDKYSELSFEGDGIKRFYDSSGQCAFIHVFGLYAIKQTSRFFFLSKLLFFIFNKAKSKQQDKSVWLFHPLVKEKIESDKLRLIAFDVFVASHQDSFDLIRCMNLLNTLQFSENQIKQAIDNLKSSLVDGGVLLLGRSTMTGEHRASLLQKLDGILVSVKEINGGSELKRLI